MKAIFYNEETERIRSGWRILLFQLTFFAILFLFRLMINVVDSEYFTTYFTRIFLAISAIIVLIIFSKLVERMPISKYGYFNNSFWFKDLLFGLFLGAFLMSLIFLIFYIAGWVEITGYYFTEKTETGFSLAFIGELIKYTGVSIHEETVSRGYFLIVLAQGFAFKSIGSKRSIIIALLISSLMFGVFHLGNSNASLASTLNISLAGILLGLSLVYTGSIAIPLGIHLTWNFFQGIVFGMPTSGFISQTHVFQTKLIGPEILTGGLFGPEAGLIGTAIILLGCGMIGYWIKFQYGYFRIETALAEVPKEEE